MSTIRLHKVKEEEFIFKPHDLKEINIDQLFNRFGLKVNADFALNQLSITLTVQYGYEISKSDVVDLVQFTVTSNYIVSDLNQVLTWKDDMFDMPDVLLQSCVSATFSTIRGMLVYKLAGTILSDFYLPFVDIKDLIETTIGVKKKETKKKKKA